MSNQGTRAGQQEVKNNLQANNNDHVMNQSSDDSVRKNKYYMRL